MKSYVRLAVRSSVSEPGNYIMFVSSVTAVVTRLLVNNGRNKSESGETADHRRLLRRFESITLED